MNSKRFTTQEQLDHMEQEARHEADEIMGEWLKEFYGERGVPGMPQAQPEPQGAYDG